MNPQETKLKQNIQRDIQMFQDKLTKLITDLVELEADIEWHFDHYNESVGNPEPPDPPLLVRGIPFSPEPAKES